jgi:hypothetical protein
MRPTPRALKTGLIAVAFLAGACGGGSDSIAGTYSCEFGEEAPAGLETPEITAELREDGTLTVTPRGTVTEGTWSVEGDQGVWHFSDRDESFTVEGETLVHEDGFVCTPAE